MKKIRYIIEATFLCLSLVIFKLMPASAASDFGGWIGRTIGPRLAASRKARANIEKSFPEKNEDEVSTIIIDMWDNLGRVMAEYPHLRTLTKKFLDVRGLENFENTDPEKSCVYIGGHLANWEMVHFFFNEKTDRTISFVHRKANNPYAESLLKYCRTRSRKGIFIPKSPKGARDLMKTVRNEGQIGIFIDQKYNQGIAVPFFGRPAMTSAAFAQLARKQDAPVLPIQMERFKGCHFRITIHPSFSVTGIDDEAALMKANSFLEDWIRERPGQWLWLHRRWDSKALQ